MIMSVNNIILLREAVDDMQDGKAFYERREIGIGDYFWDSLISDIESLYLYAGIHRKEFGFYRMLS